MNRSVLSWFGAAVPQSPASSNAENRKASDAQDGFRVRAPARDSVTDAQRMARLKTFIEAMATEIADEENGLRKRLESNRADAAWLMDAMQNEDISDRQALRVDDLEAEIIYAHERLALLGKQAAYVKGLLGAQPAPFADDIVLENPAYDPCLANRSATS